jgi:transcriptional regulator with XRE-family HTH domain
MRGMKKDDADLDESEPTMCLVRRAHSRGFPGNYLKRMRECAGLSQRVLGLQLALDATRITRIERDQVPLAGSYALIVGWARACGYGPWDVGLQRFLLQSGNPPWLPEGDAQAVRYVARRAAALAMLPRPSDREIVARRVAQHRAAWAATATGADDALTRIPQPVGARPCR